MHQAELQFSTTSARDETLAHDAGRLCNYLKGQGFVKGTKIQHDLGWDEKYLRDVRAATNGAILSGPGRLGYCLMLEAKIEDYDRIIAARRSQLQKMDQDTTAMVFSLEMSAFQLVERLLYARARFDKSKVAKGFQSTKQDLTNIKRASEQIKDSKLFIDDTAAITINELRAKARRKKKEEDIQVITVDYLQLMRSNSKQAQNSREREVAEISAGLKGLAKELNIPIIVLAQLNRGPETRVGSGGKPRMSDLRESGSIEQDADMVGLLYRSAYYADDDDPDAAENGEAQLVIAKNRNGPTGDVPLTFIKEIMRFESRAFRDPPA